MVAKRLLSHWDSRETVDSLSHDFAATRVIVPTSLGKHGVGSGLRDDKVPARASWPDKNEGGADPCRLCQFPRQGNVTDGLIGAFSPRVFSLPDMPRWDRNYGDVLVLGESRPKGAQRLYKGVRRAEVPRRVAVTSRVVNGRLRAMKRVGTTPSRRFLDRVGSRSWSKNGGAVPRDPSARCAGLRLRERPLNPPLPCPGPGEGVGGSLHAERDLGAAQAKGQFMATSVSSGPGEGPGEGEQREAPFLATLSKSEEASRLRR